METRPPMNDEYNIVRLTVNDAWFLSQIIVRYRRTLGKSFTRRIWTKIQKIIGHDVSSTSSGNTWRRFRRWVRSSSSKLQFVADEHSIRCDVVVWDSLSPIPRDQLRTKIRGVDGIYCVLTDVIDKEMLDAAGPQLKVVATMSVGYNHLDIETMKSRGIRVGYTPDVLTDATSELTVALLLATSRRLLEAEKAMKAGQWTSWSPSFMCGPGLAGSTVGIVGLGRIGSRVAEYLNGFRVKKIIYTSRTEKVEAKKFGGELVSLDKLLADSDFVVVTSALTPETREMFDAVTFGKMKKTAIFINVSRGELVDQPALIEALKNRTIRAAGLDVMTPEPIPLDSELLKLDNCVVMPHLGSATNETRQEMARITAMNILAVLDGEPEKMPAELKL